MTNLDIIRDAIETLERQEITYAVAAKLADLYIVLDHIEGVKKPVAQIVEVADEKPEAKSDFLKAVEKAGAARAWSVMDDLMTTLQAVNARLYDGVMRQLTES